MDGGIGAFRFAIETKTEASGELAKAAHERFGAIIGGRRCAAQQFARTVLVLLLKLMDLLLLLLTLLWKKKNEIKRSREKLMTCTRRFPEAD